jgi:hypothetical protein
VSVKKTIGSLARNGKPSKNGMDDKKFVVGTRRGLEKLGARCSYSAQDICVHFSFPCPRSTPSSQLLRVSYFLELAL